MKMKSENKKAIYKELTKIDVYTENSPRRIKIEQSIDEIIRILIKEDE